MIYLIINFISIYSCILPGRIESLNVIQNVPISFEISFDEESGLEKKVFLKICNNTDEIITILDPKLWLNSVPVLLNENKKEEFFVKTILANKVKIKTSFIKIPAKESYKTEFDYTINELFFSEETKGNFTVYFIYQGGIWDSNDNLVFEKEINSNSLQFTIE
ncbi:hypothetical protein [uncultured Aquimarina sp.]|uniref:hypothetical protein n=1 Tax=uncultured Aquimarina sp. TaxID=575652 RepID=UPI00263837E4|nr:hypothetical protein [uncultured Aquimarina sp.]